MVSCPSLKLIKRNEFNSPSKSFQKRKSLEGTEERSVPEDYTCCMLTHRNLSDRWVSITPSPPPHEGQSNDISMAAGVLQTVVKPNYFFRLSLLFRNNPLFVCDNSKHLLQRQVIAPLLNFPSQ